MISMRDDAFIRVIMARPADPLPKLIYADWLDENGHCGSAARWAAETHRYPNPCLSSAHHPGGVSRPSWDWYYGDDWWESQWHHACLPAEILSAIPPTTDDGFGTFREYDSPGEAWAALITAYSHIHTMG